MVLDDIDGTVEVRHSTTISNESGSTASAIDVQNSSGQISFGEANVTDATGNPGVNLENNTGLTWFDSLDITSNNATAHLRPQCRLAGCESARNSGGRRNGPRDEWHRHRHRRYGRQCELHERVQQQRRRRLTACQRERKLQRFGRCRRYARARAVR